MNRQLQRYLLCSVLTGLSLANINDFAQAQSIVPAIDGSGTVVQLEDKTFQITGGSLSDNGTNLFHSFEKFGLTVDEAANFVAIPGIENILGRVLGGEASYIDGVVKVTNGTANLILVNPYGILTGVNSRIDVPGSFTATTADRLGFGNTWLDVLGTVEYSILEGSPDRFAFSAFEPGAIVHEGSIRVAQGQELRLIGGTVLSTGTLDAQTEKVMLKAVSGGQVLTLSSAGSSRSFLPTSPNFFLLNIKSLPSLLEQRENAQASRITIDSNGSIRLEGSDTQVITANSSTERSISLLTTSNLAFFSLDADETQTIGGNAGNISLTADASNYIDRALSLRISEEDSLYQRQLSKSGLNNDLQIVQSPEMIKPPPVTNPSSIAYTQSRIVGEELISSTPGASTLSSSSPSSFLEVDRVTVEECRDTDITKLQWLRSNIPIAISTTEKPINDVISAWRKKCDELLAEKQLLYLLQD